VTGNAGLPCFPDRSGYGSAQTAGSGKTLTPIASGYARLATALPFAGDHRQAVIWPCLVFHACDERLRCVIDRADVA
jgi:hypothetical protein